MTKHGPTCKYGLKYEYARKHDGILSIKVKTSRWPIYLKGGLKHALKCEMGLYLKCKGLGPV